MSPLSATPAPSDRDNRLEQIAVLAEKHDYDPAVMVGAAEILAVLKAIPCEHRMTTLAVVCRVFCDTDGAIEVKRRG